MEDLDEFHQSSAVIEDFARNTLDRIPGGISRLLHVAMLRDLATGRYHHEGLAALYSEPAVDQALRLCHEELFERLLEAPLQEQEVELRQCLATLGAGAEEISARWKEHEFYKCLIPSGVPAYLRQLFCSNFAALLEVTIQDGIRRQSGA